MALLRLSNFKMDLPKTHLMFPRDNSAIFFCVRQTALGGMFPNFARCNRSAAPGRQTPNPSGASKVGVRRSVRCPRQVPTQRSEIRNVQHL